MECNKDEAIRAREFAETKMHKNDFAGARKLALKAQQIYPDIDNILQLLTVCDVHCASQQKIDVYEMDWYGILQIAQTADDSLIKKHYRKLALLLHPDKNKLPGAEAAFKLIGEAQRLLSDPVKRRMHDMKRRTNMQPMNQYAGRQSVQNGFKGPPVPQYANVNLWQQPQPPDQPAFHLSIFATRCPFCTAMRHASVSVRNTSVLCFSCKKSYIAYEVTSGNLTKERKDKKAAFVQKEVPIQGQSDTSMKFKENVHSHTNGSTEAACSKGDVKNSNDTKSNKVNKRKRAHSEEASEDIDSYSKSDTDEDEIFTVDDKLHNDHSIRTGGLQNPRRSTRQKQKISYDESPSDDDDLLGDDKAAKVNSTSESENQGAKFEGIENESNHGDFEPASNNSLNRCSRAQELKRESPAEGDDRYSYPEPEFNNFDDFRKDECFRVGQIWALYDDVGAMPRFYGIVKNLYWSNKKLRLTWLERVADDDVTQKRADRWLPYSFGKYSSGPTETMDMGVGMFSHQVTWEEGSDKNTYFIYPRQGQIWALFKNWNTNPASESTSTKTYEYEYVEVISVEGHGVTVSYLGKAKGYASIFCRMDSNGRNCCIPREEMVRFSHMIPSFQLTNEERGVFELDPASVPINQESAVDLEDLKIFLGNFKPSAENINDGASSRCSRDNWCGKGTQDNNSGNQSEDPSSPTSSSEANEIPDPEFFLFETNRSEDKFKVGQIWAVYGGDGFPKYYVQIKRIRSSPEFEVATKWLTNCPEQGDIIHWHDEEMPAGCGIFELSREKLEKFPPATFSHLLNPQATGKKGEFAVLPKKGEVWALYKDWKPEMNFSDLEAFEYEIAEVLNMDDLTVEVLPLHHVSGHVTVFRGQANREETKRIPKTELLRFSHQIPSFLLTDELDGTLRGCWELDPAAVPPALLC
ncbi:unnamed protein product [Rhodiola kirilowii]